MNEEHLNENEFMYLKNKISGREEERKKELRIQLQTAKEQCPPDKERFSSEVFKKLYDLTDDRGESIITPDIIEGLEIQYYLTYSHLKSMKEFAKYREYLDSHNVG